MVVGTLAPPDSVWGPAVWDALHALSFSYPIHAPAGSAHREAFLGLLTSLKTLLPCPRCREHFSEWMHSNARTDLSPIFDGRESLSKALVELHNNVRTLQGKTTIDFGEVRDRYATNARGCPTSKANPSHPSVKGGVLGADLGSVHVAGIVGMLLLVILVVVLCLRSGR